MPHSVAILHYRLVTVPTGRAGYVLYRALVCLFFLSRIYNGKIDSNVLFYTCATLKGQVWCLTEAKYSARLSFSVLKVYKKFVYLLVSLDVAMLLFFLFCGNWVATTAYHSNFTASCILLPSCDIKNIQSVSLKVPFNCVGVSVRNG